MSSLLQIAPMVDWTYSAYRVFLRLMLPQAKLFTEMLVPRAIIHHPQRFLKYDAIEHPLVLQLGGSDLHELVQAGLLADAMDYDEVNLNLGCPSERVQAGAFGACLMKEKNLVKSCLGALQDKLSIPVTAKTRIGVDELDSYAFFADFVGGLVEVGCHEIIIHARKAFLKGLNPKQNRSIPPIQYDYVYRIKAEFPDTRFIINGEIKNLAEVKTHLSQVDGVMIGRLACDNPFALQTIHQALFPQKNLKSRAWVIRSYLAWMKQESWQEARIALYLKPLFNAYHGTIYTKRWKQCLQEALKLKSILQVEAFMNRELENI